jgi:hypothetical protein
MKSALDVHFRLAGRVPGMSADTSTLEKGSHTRRRFGSWNLFGGIIWFCRFCLVCLRWKESPLSLNDNKASYDY